MRNVMGDVNREGLCIHICRLDIYKYGNSMSYSVREISVTSMFTSLRSLQSLQSLQRCSALHREMFQVPPALAMPQAFEALDHSDLKTKTAWKKSANQRSPSRSFIRFIYIIHSLIQYINLININKHIVSTGFNRTSFRQHTAKHSSRL